MTIATAFSLPSPSASELVQLFRDFRATYLPLPPAQQYLAALTDARAVAVHNFPLLARQAEQGATLTDELLLKLLPYADTPNNRWRGAWIHPVAAIAGDLRTWYEAAGWTASEDWPSIATALLGFVRQATTEPAQLGDACATWVALPYSTGFQSGLLTPILNALRPAAFLIVNNQSRNLLNYFAGTSYTQSLADYPAANDHLVALFETLYRNAKDAPASPQQRADHALLFAHWLTTEKRFAFRVGRAWALDVGDDPWIWQEWRDGNMIAIGGPGAWDELGDLTGVARRDFYQRRDSLIAQHSTWTKRSAEPIWRFARQMHEGDNVVLYHDGAILAIGVITGPYYFVADVPLGHRRPVEWRDLTPRRHGTTFADSILTPIEAELFAALAAAPPSDEDTPRVAPSLRQATDGTAADKAQPEFVYYLAPLLETLQAMGGSGRAGDVIDAVRDRLAGSAPATGLSPTRINRFRRHLYRARHYLIRAGLLTTAQHGVWQLTRPGRNAALIDGDAQELYEEIEYQQQLTESLAGASDTVRRLAETLVTYTATTDLSTATPPQPDIVAATATPAASYSLAHVAAATFLPETQLARWVQAIERKGQAIFYGPPGVGKTFLAEQLARHLAGEPLDVNESLTSEGFVETVQFHAAYAYEDFVQGLRPQPGLDGQLSYPIVPGRFLTFCTTAAQREGRCILIIDEINRADLARVFGELLYLLEYRDRTVRLAADGRPFGIPANVRIIGTMNTADRSIALVDHALRRRFAFIALQPDWDILRRFHEHHQSDYPIEPLIALLQRVNRQIGDPQHAIGHSFFMSTALSETIADIWQLEIEPYLEEIFFDQPDAVDLLRWARVRDGLLRKS